MAKDKLQAAYRRSSRNALLESIVVRASYAHGAAEGAPWRVARAHCKARPPLSTQAAAALARAATSPGAVSSAPVGARLPLTAPVPRATAVKILIYTAPAAPRQRLHAAGTSSTPPPAPPQLLRQRALTTATASPPERTLLCIAPSSSPRPMSAAFASTSSPHPPNMLSLPFASPPDPLTPYDSLTILDDPFPSYSSRPVNPALPRLSPPHLAVPSQSQPLPPNHPAAVKHPRLPLPSPSASANPAAYGLSPRLPSALPPSASPRVVEPVTPDRQPLPFSADEAAVLCERAPIGTVDDRAADFIFDNVPRRSLSCPSSSAPALDSATQHEKLATMSLQLPLDPAITPSPPQVQSLPMRSLPLANSSSSSLMLDTTSAAAAVSTTAMTTSNPAQNALSPFGLSTRHNTTAAIDAAVDNPAFHPWSKDIDQMEDIPSCAPKVEQTAAAVFAASSASTVPAAQAAPSLSAAPHRPAPASSAVACMPLPDSSLFPSPTVARSLCTFTQFPDFSSAPTTTSSITELDPMQVGCTQPAQTRSSQVVSDESTLKRAVCIPKRSIPRPGDVSAAVAAPDASTDRLRCHMCGQRFARRSNLFKHQRSVHDDRRRFACRSCPYKFKRQDHLLKHVRSVHERMRNFVCDICGFGFAEKFNRDKHRRSIHMAKRAFQCPCGAYFQDREKMLKCLRCRQTSNRSNTATACTNDMGTVTF